MLQKLTQYLWILFIRLSLTEGYQYEVPSENWFRYINIWDLIVNHYTRRRTISLVYHKAANDDLKILFTWKAIWRTIVLAKVKRENNILTYEFSWIHILLL